MARLRKEEEARAYERMLNPQLSMETFSQRFPTSPHAHLFPPSHSIEKEEDEVSYADINRQMALIINVLLSIVACSVAIWLAASHWSTPTRLGLSMSGSGVVGVAEVVVYAGYLRRVKEAKIRAKTKSEVKEIIKTWVIGKDEDDVDETHSKDLSTPAHDETSLRKRLHRGAEITKG